MTIYRIIREEGLLNHRGRACHPREPRPVPMLGIQGYSSSADLEYQPGAKSCKRTTLLPLYGDGCMENARLGSGCPWAGLQPSGP